MNNLISPEVRRRSPDRGLWMTMFSRATLLREAIPFMDPIDEICEEPPPRFLRGIHYLVVCMLLGLLGVAAVAKVDVVVVGTGRIATATPPIVLQPMDRAIIRELKVRPGDLVTKGQVLATLDPTFARADAVALETQLHALRAQVRRLESEIGGTPFVAGAAPGADELLQATLYQQRQAQYATRLRVFDEDIGRLEASLRTAEDGRSALGREVDVAKAVESVRSSLLQSQNGSRLQWLEAEAARMRTERDQQEAGNHLSELHHGIQSRAAERQAFVDEWRRELLEALVAARGEAGRVAESLTKAARLNDLVVVTAPADGVVLDVARRTEGSVLREAEPLVTMVANDAQLIAEITIGSADVGYTSPGAPVELKVDAFPYQRHGLVSGRLTSIGEESFAAGAGPDVMPTGRGGAFHRGRVELLDTKLQHVPTGGRLFPGMTVTADIRVGSRSVLSYLLYPLARGLSESAREP